MSVTPEPETSPISREAGDKLKGYRFQKLRAAIRFLTRAAEAAGQVYCAIELLEDSVVIDGQAGALLDAEENKFYTSALSLNSHAIKNTLVAFLDLTCVFPDSKSLRLGIYASAALADERIPAETLGKVASGETSSTRQILKNLAADQPLGDADVLLARHIVLEEYKAQYKDRRGFYSQIEAWSIKEFRDFLAGIDWSISQESTEDLFARAVEQVRNSRFFSYRHEGLEEFLLCRLLDLLEERSQATNPIDRIVGLSDLQLIFNQSLGNAAGNLASKPLDPAAETWSTVDTNDSRNLEEKILAVAPSYPAASIRRMARKCALARSDASAFEHEYVSLKRRVLDVCDERLPELTQNSDVMSANDIDQIIDELTRISVGHMADISRSYHYNIRDPLTIKGAVLTLFDDCFLAFDDHAPQSE